MQQALAYYWGLARQGLVDQNCDYQCAQTAFTNGQQAYLISGIWAFSDLQLVMGDQLGVAALPTINKKIMRSYFTSHALGFPRQSLYGPKREALLSLIDYMQSQQAQTQIWQYMKTLPVSQGVLDSIAITPDTNMQNLLQQFDQSVQMPSSFVMAIVWEAMLKGSRRYGAGILDAQHAAIFMQHLAEKSIAYKYVQD
jgi:maltose-binding protein MalE